LTVAKANRAWTRRSINHSRQTQIRSS